MIAKTPEAPYWAVIFTSLRSEREEDAYGETAARMEQLAAGQEGFLGIESVRDADGFGITVSYWRDEAAMKTWKRNAEHLVAQRRGREDWYRAFRVRVCRVERDYGT
jgi:heme-degrading monooxygenase HmoA